MNYIIPILAVLVMVLAASLETDPAHSAVTCWTDAGGVTHCTDSTGGSATCYTDAGGVTHCY